MISAREALDRLKAGNRRFATDERTIESLVCAARRRDLSTGQEPFAIILGCSDSRVPAEIVFDQGLGDLFVIRIAGNIVAASQIDSVEFAVTSFGTPLVVVLGHSHCGAIEATVDALQASAYSRSPHISSIVERVRPAIAELLETDLRHDREALLRHAVRANVRASVSHLRHGSRTLEQLVQTGRVEIVGAEYSLQTGVVDFLD